MVTPLNLGPTMKDMLRIALFLTGGLLLASAQAQMMKMSGQDAAMQPGRHVAVTVAKTRFDVVFPPPVKHQALAAMRMHLQGLGEIQRALAEHHFDEAAQIATMKLGMSSMHGSQMEEESRYMPAGMKQLGAQLHREAGEFALAAQDASVSGNIEKPLMLLSRMTRTCVACHATYRLR